MNLSLTKLNLLALLRDGTTYQGCLLSKAAKLIPGFNPSVVMGLSPEYAQANQELYELANMGLVELNEGLTYLVCTKVWKLTLEGWLIVTEQSIVP